MPGEGDASPTERELLELADELIAQAAEIRRQWTELARAVGSTPRPATGSQADAAAGAGSDPRRLVALEMMLSGRSREEIEAHLRTEFGEAAARTIIADVYGPS